MKPLKRQVVDEVDTKIIFAESSSGAHRSYECVEFTSLRATDGEGKPARLHLNRLAVAGLATETCFVIHDEYDNFRRVKEFKGEDINLNQELNDIFNNQAKGYKNEY